MSDVQMQSTQTIYDLQFEDLSVLEQPQRLAVNSMPFCFFIFNGNTCMILVSWSIGHPISQRI